MSGTGTSVEEIVEVLNNIFIKCDENGSGVVEMHTLSDILISQDPSWQENERIREEFETLLSCHEPTHLITKDHFMKCLLEWFQSSNSSETPEVLCVVDIGEKSSSSSTSGIGESSEVSSGSVTDSVQDNFPLINFDEHQPLQSEEFVDDFSLADSESPRYNSSRVLALEDKLNLLQRINESMEKENSSFLSQISSMEEALSHKENELASHLKKLETYNRVSEMCKQKQEETEEKLNLTMEENKSITIQLSHCERENKKLKDLIFQLEAQVEAKTMENKPLEKKYDDLLDRFKVLTENYNALLEELETIKSSEAITRVEDVMERNSILQNQLESSCSIIQDIKSELSDAYRKLSNVQNDKVKNRIQCKKSADNISSDNSLVLYDENFTLDSTIPFETSLLAELQEKADQDSHDCYICSNNISFTSFSSVAVGNDFGHTADAAINTDKKEFVDGSTLTTHLSEKDLGIKDPLVCKEVGVNCSLKEVEICEISTIKRCQICNLNFKRSLRKWIALGVVLLLLCVLLGFFLSLVSISYSLKHSPKPHYCLSTVFDLFYTTIQQTRIV